MTFAVVYPKDIENLRTYKEGSKNIIISKVQRKRNIQARLECLKIHGYKCAICGFESEKVYERRKNRRFKPKW